MDKVVLCFIKQLRQLSPLWGVVLVFSLAACGRSPVVAPLVSPSAVASSTKANLASPSPRPSLSPTEIRPSATPVPPPTPASPPPTSGVSKQDQSTPTKQEAVLIYRRSGGLAGLVEQWQVFADGRVLGPDGQARQEPVPQVEQLLDELKQAGFFELENSYLPKNTCCDRVTFELSVRQGETIKKVSALGSTPDTPAVVWEIFEKVQRWLAETE